LQQNHEVQFHASMWSMGYVCALHISTFQVLLNQNVADVNLGFSIVPLVALHLHAVLTSPVLKMISNRRMPVT